MAWSAEEWQEALDRDGVVVVDQKRSSRVLGLVMMLLGFVLVVGILRNIASQGPDVVNVVALLFFGFSMVIPLLRLRQEARSLVVTREGLRVGDGSTVPFDQVVEIYFTPRNFVVLHRHLPGQRMTGKDGRRSLVFRLPDGLPAEDLAVWLVRLRDGPDAAVQSRERRGVRIYGSPT